MLVKKRQAQVLIPEEHCVSDLQWEESAPLIVTCTGWLSSKVRGKPSKGLTADAYM